MLLRALRLLPQIHFAPETGDGEDLVLPVDDTVDEEDDETVTDPVEPEETEVATTTTPDPEEPRGRAGDTIRSLRSRAQESDRQRDEAQRRADDADRRIREFESRQRPQIDPQEEARRLEVMTPDERADYKVNKALERFQSVQQVQQFQTMEALDKQTFQSHCETNPLARRYHDDVERELTKIRSEGGNVPRQAVLYYVLGRALYDKQKTGDKRPAQDRIRRAQTRPGNSRGDVGANRRPSKTAEDRLENVPI